MVREDVLVVGHWIHIPVGNTISSGPMAFYEDFLLSKQNNRPKGFLTIYYLRRILEYTYVISLLVTSILILRIVNIIYPP